MWLDEAAAKSELQTQYGVSRETMDLLETYVEHLRHWQKTTNLIAPSTLDFIWSRHIADCAQLLCLKPEARRWLDLGSGGGLPGLVLACQLRPLGGTVDLVESNSKKAAFLRYVATTLALPARIHASRLEAAIPSLPKPEVVTARALTSLTELLGYTKELLKSGSTGLFPKGRDYAAELTEAGKHWHFSYELHMSRTEPEARIIEITALT